MAESLAEARPRHLFIDLYRAAVIVIMLEGHVVRAFLALPLQQTKFFQIHEFIHGLSAPAFLFGAGLTFVISTRRRWEEFHHWGPTLARRVRKLVFILLLGLMLHLPFFSVRKIIIDGTTTNYLQLFQSDVLACIGIGLLFLHAVVFFFKTERNFYALVSVAVILVGLLTPVMWGIDFLRILPIPIAQLMNGHHGSFFPLFPYVGFLFTGVIVSWQYLIAVRLHHQPRFMLKLGVLGAAMVAGGMIFDALPFPLYRDYDFWTTSPNYFLIRVGMLMLFSAGIWYVSRNMNSSSILLTVLGRESLFVYVLHLLILYGSAINPDLNLQVILGSNLSLWRSAVIFVMMTSVLLAVASGWNYLKRSHFNAYRFIQLTTSAVVLYYFFVRDF